MDKAFAAVITVFPWFSSLGRAEAVNLPIPTAIVTAQQDALRHCSEPGWEDVTLEARNRLTEFLCLRYRERYQEWNDITEAAKTEVVTPLTERVWRPFAELHGLGKVFVDCVSWDILAAIMEHEYRDCNGRPAFFLTLLDVYRAGHFPCGWRGRWPNGNLLVW